MDNNKINSVLNILILLILLGVIICLYLIKFDIKMDAIDYHWSAVKYFEKGNLHTNIVNVSPFLITVLFLIKNFIKKD